MTTSSPPNPAAPNNHIGAKAKILLVEDHDIVRFGLQQLIDREPDLETCGAEVDGARAMKAVVLLNPDLMVIDLSLKNDSSGLELMRSIKQLYPQLPMLVLSARDESLYAEVSFRAGAMGYVMKGETVDKILDAIRRLLAGKAYVSEAQAQLMAQKQVLTHTNTNPSPLGSLSDRELEVFRLIGAWKSTRYIADVLHLSPKTIEYYRDQIKWKLGLDTAVELTQAATTWALMEMVPVQVSQTTLVA